MRFKKFIIFALALIPAWQALADEVDTTTPAVQTAEWAVNWWMPRHEAKLIEIAEKNPQLIFIGDSITHSWPDVARENWDDNFSQYNTVNLGFGGDRTEHVMWRLLNGEIDGINPKAAVVMIGTNNIGQIQTPPKDVARGVKMILGTLRSKLPETKILLLAVFPREHLPNAPYRKMVNELNEYLPAMADGKMILFQDINHVFLDRDGKLPVKIMGDFLHPGVEGYQLWADAIRPTIKTLMQP